MNTKKIKTHFKKAFTLVELIIVIAVIAILAVFLIPNFSNVLGDANATNVKSDTANIKNIVMAYISEVGAVPVANINTTKDGELSNVLTINGEYRPGISTAEFQIKAEAKDVADGHKNYYVIDMDLLTKAQINVEDKVSKTSAKLASTPGTSAIVDIASVDETTKPQATPNKKIKNTSVVYVIDKDLNVYAAYSKAIKTTLKERATIDGAVFDLLTDANIEGLTPVQNSIFKTQSYTLAAGQVEAALIAEDSNYNV